MPAATKAAPPPVRVHGASVEMVPLAKLKAYEKNARLHPEDQLKALEAIIRDSGFTAPLVIDPQNSIIAGHGRALVAKRLGMVEVPCVRVTGLTEPQITALRLSDNQAALRGGWDKDLLLAELSGLQGLGFDLSLTAFAPLELGSLGVKGFSTEERLAAAEATPTLPAKPVVALGEIWLLGQHRLIIGDSTDAKVVDRLLRGFKPPCLMVTDPPYGVNYDPSWRATTKRSNGQPLSTGKVSMGKVANDANADWRPAWALFPGQVAYVWHGEQQLIDMGLQLRESGLLPRNLIVWGKPALVISRGHYHPQHETCWYAVRKGETALWAGDRKQSTLWAIANAAGAHGPDDDGKTSHGTQKPIECMRRPILNNSKPGDAVYDPFCGSGTTLIAAEMEGRRCYAVELDPAYAEVIITRWQKFTGKTATREDSRTLASLKRKKAA